MTKICEGFAGGFAQVHRTLDRAHQLVEGVMRTQKSGEAVKLYGRFMGGSDRNTSNSGRSAQLVHDMQSVQSRINTGYCASR